MQPAIVRPRGPRMSRPADETNPSVARSPRPPRLASATTGAPIVAPTIVGLPVDGLDVAGVHPHGREVEVGVRAGHRAGLPAAVREVDGDLGAAQVVGVREDASGGDDHAAPAPPAPAEADHGRADTLGGRGDGLLDVCDGAQSDAPPLE